MAKRRVVRGVRRGKPRTGKQKAQLKRAQLISARKRKGKGSKSRTAIKAIGGVAAVGGAAYLYDRQVNQVALYHNTQRHSAVQIKKFGFQPPSSRSAISNGGALHGAGDEIFFAAKVNNAKFFGNTTLKTRVRKSKLRQYGAQDQHPAAIAGGFTNFVSIRQGDLAKVGVTPKRLKLDFNGVTKASIRSRTKGVTPGGRHVTDSGTVLRGMSADPGSPKRNVRVKADRKVTVAGMGGASAMEKNVDDILADLTKRLIGIKNKRTGKVPPAHARRLKKAQAEARKFKRDVEDFVTWNGP